MGVSETDRQKAAAAAEAVERVRDGMVVGLGTGSTAAHAVRALGERVRTGLKVRGSPRRTRPRPSRASWASRSSAST